MHVGYLTSLPVPHMYTCMYMYICVYSVHVRMLLGMYYFACTHTRARTHTRTQMHARTHTYTHTNARTHTHTHTHTDMTPASAPPPVPLPAPSRGILKNRLVPGVRKMKRERVKWDRSGERLHTCTHNWVGLCNSPTVYMCVCSFKPVGWLHVQCTCTCMCTLLHVRSCKTQHTHVLLYTYM